MFVFSLFTSNNATLLGEAQMPTYYAMNYHAAFCHSLYKFVICCYLVVTGHCSKGADLREILGLNIVLSPPLPSLPLSYRRRVLKSS